MHAYIVANARCFVSQNSESDSHIIIVDEIMLTAGAMHKCDELQDRTTTRSSQMQGIFRLEWENYLCVYEHNFNILKYPHRKW